jgi:protein SCO1/2
MTKRRAFDWHVWFYVGSVLVVPVVLFFILNKTTTSHELPILGPKSTDPEGNAIVHHILDFNLIDQNGDSVSLRDTKGKVVVAGFFFASCGTICPKMTTSLTRVQDRFWNQDLVILYHSVDPVRDSVPILASYGIQRGVKSPNWYLLTGDKKQIYLLARNSYFITTVEGDGGPNDFIHEELFALIDREGRIRGYYKGTEKNSVDQLMKDIERLL